MPRTIEKLSAKQFYHYVHLFSLFPQLKTIVLNFGTQVSSTGGQAPEEYAFYEEMFR